MAFRRKTLIITSLVLLAGIFLVLPLLNPLLEKTLDTYLRQKIEIRQSSPLYAFSYETLEMNIYKRQITLYNFRMTPRDSVREAFRNGETEISSLKDLKISRVEIEGVVLANFLWNKHLDINKIQVDSVALDLYIDARSKTKPASEPKKGPTGVSLEGIRLPGMRELTLESFNLDNLTLHQILLPSRDTLIKFTSQGGRIDGLGMAKPSKDEASFFVPKLKNFTLFLNSEVLDLRKNLYTMGFRNMEYSFAEQNLHVRDLLFEPREVRDSFRLKNRYSYEIYEATSTDLILEDFDLNDFLNEGEFLTNRMLIDSLRLEIYRDKSLPFNTEKKRLLINQILAQGSFPFHVGEVNFRDAYLNYVEQTDVRAAPLVVDFADMDGTITNLTTIPDSMEASKPLMIKLNANLDQVIPMEVQIEMPYHSEFISAKGHTEGTSDFSSLNKTVLPAVGLQFKSGRLDGLNFNVKGTPRSLDGNLTLLYHNLEVSLYKENYKKRKTLSWAANMLLKRSNPKPNGNTVVGEIHTERLPYKGLGNYLWKAVESGLINSLSPFGKHRVVKK